jgi:hypothetical protein
MPVQSTGTDTTSLSYYLFEHLTAIQDGLSNFQSFSYKFAPLRDVLLFQHNVRYFRDETLSLVDSPQQNTVPFALFSEEGRRCPYHVCNVKT